MFEGRIETSISLERSRVYLRDVGFKICQEASQAL